MAAGHRRIKSGDVLIFLRKSDRQLVRPEVLGLHLVPAFDPVFEKIRYMSSTNTARKYKVADYITEYTPKEIR